MLGEWTDSGSAELIERAAQLLEGAPSAFVFKRVGFVSNLLERAHVASPDCYRNATSSHFPYWESSDSKGSPNEMVAS